MSLCRMRRATLFSNFHWTSFPANLQYIYKELCRRIHAINRYWSCQWDLPCKNAQVSLFIWQTEIIFMFTVRLLIGCCIFHIYFSLYNCKSKVSLQYLDSFCRDCISKQVGQGGRFPVASSASLWSTRFTLRFLCFLHQLGAYNTWFVHTCACPYARSVLYLRFGLRVYLVVNLDCCCFCVVVLRPR